MNDELDWLAFRYVAGEMTADEEERFEERLARDQLAREAVDHAVELNEAIRLVASESAPVIASRVRHSGSREGRAIRRSMAWGTAALACLALVACLVWLTSGSHQGPVARGDRESQGPEFSPSSLQDRTALAWAGLRHERHGQSLSAEGPWSTIVLEGQPPGVGAGNDGIQQSRPSVPQWLVTAFSAETEQPTEVP
jgi:hypothetical protein